MTLHGSAGSWRSSNAYMLFVIQFVQIGFTWFDLAVMHVLNRDMAQFFRAGFVVNPSAAFLITNASNIVPACFGLAFGIWASVGTLSRLNLIPGVLAVAAIVAMLAAPSITTFAIGTFFVSLWNTGFLVFNLTYFTRATHISTRTTFFVIAFYTLNSIAVSAISAIEVACPDQIVSYNVACGVSLSILLCGFILLFTLPERPASFHSKPGRRLLDCWALVYFNRNSFLSSVACLILICTSGFGYWVFAEFLNSIQSTFTISAALILYLVTFASATVYLVMMILALRRFSDRQILMFNAGMLIVGYLLVLPVGMDTSARYLIGAITIALADGSVTSVGTALLSKLCAPGGEGLWMGVVVCIHRGVIEFFTTLYLSTAYSTTTYAITLVLVFVALLLQIPVYKYLIPQFYSPWSGSVLPVNVGSNVSSSTPLIQRSDLSTVAYPVETMPFAELD